MRKVGMAEKHNPYLLQTSIIEQLMSYPQSSLFCLHGIMKMYLFVTSCSLKLEVCLYCFCCCSCLLSPGGEYEGGSWSAGVSQSITEPEFNNWNFLNILSSTFNLNCKLPGENPLRQMSFIHYAGVKNYPCVLIDIHH